MAQFSMEIMRVTGSVLRGNQHSGAALALASEKKVDRAPFRAKTVTAGSIEAFNRLKGWLGPHPVTVRKNDGYRSYVEARNAEAPKTRRALPKSPSLRELDRMVDRIPSMDDRNEIRRQLERGRKDKADLDHVLNMVTKLPGVDLDAGNAGKSGKYELKLASAGVDEPTREILLTLVRRLTDNDGFLRDFDLVFRSGRVKMNFGTGQDLIFPEEMATLSRLAWFQPPVRPVNIDLEPG